jgi:hypothetical protein
MSWAGPQGEKRERKKKKWRWAGPIGNEREREKRMQSKCF